MLMFNQSTRGALLTCLLLSLGLETTLAQTASLVIEPAHPYAATITQEDLSRHLHIIAADSMEGRYTGSAGQKKAARYIAEHFQAIGLQAPVKTPEGMQYFQTFEMVTRSWKEVYVKVGKQKFAFMEDVYAIGNSNAQGELSLDIVYGGAGTPTELASLSLKGKGLVLRETEPEELYKAATLAREKGARALFVLKGETKEDFKEAVEYNAYYLKRGYRGLSNPRRPETAVFYISSALAKTIFGKEVSDILKAPAGSLKGKSVALQATMTEKIEFSSENVLGFLEGTDKKDEVLVITAHYDHIGKRGEEINNGADDDGSGTVSVLEIAQAFAQAKAAGKGPRRSILFMTVAGEELGLFGSQYYADFDPVFPLQNTVANLNIDMVGRIGGDYIEINEPNYVYLIGSDKLSTELHQLSEAANRETVNLKLDYKYNDENDPNRFYYRSDHYNFAKNDIPIIFYFNGTHPDYHQPTDTVEKIHFPKLEKIARLVFYTAWEVSNRENRIRVDKADK
ncbi:MAG: hypothetical protein OHK0053_15730 [Microscillaceae bacterium]